jgi:hypothetical protein
VLPLGRLDFGVASDANRKEAFMLVDMAAQAGNFAVNGLSEQAWQQCKKLQLKQVLISIVLDAVPPLADD